MADPKLINVTIIPAQPGYKLLWRSMVEKDNTAENMLPSWFSDIFGWSVETFQRDNGETYSFVTAVTIDGAIEAEHAIIYPSGVVEVPHDTTLPNLQAYIDHVKEQDYGKDA